MNITDEEIIANIEKTIKELERLRINVLKKQKPQPTKLRLIKFQNKYIEENEEEMPANFDKFGKGSIRKITRQRQDYNYTYWEFRYYNGGTQKTITAKTRDALYAKIKSIKPEKQKVNCQNLENWLQKYFNIYCADLADNTKVGYQIIIKKHISEELKKTELKKLTNVQLQDNINQIKSSRQRMATKVFLMAALKKAHADKLIDIKPWEVVKTKKHIYKSKSILSTADEFRLFKIMPERYKDAITGYLFTGCRLQELLNIKECDINRIDKTININGTKTESSRRTIPLFKQLENILPIKNVNAASLQKVLKTCVNQLDLDLTIHDLRHTFATRCLEKGVNIKTVQQWLGHKSYNITANLYTHLTVEFIKSEQEKLED